MNNNATYNVDAENHTMDLAWNLYNMRIISWETYDSIADYVYYDRVPVPA